MSRFVVASDGSRVNLDRLLSIRFEGLGGDPEAERSRIYGVVSAEDRSLDVELCQGMTEAVARIWERWETFTRDGMKLGRSVELEEAKILGIDTGELAAGLATVPPPVPVPPDPELDPVDVGSRGYVDQTKYGQPTEEHR